MAKDKIAYVCSNCGQESSKWIGKCPSCGQWNTFKEIRIANDTGSQAARNAGMSMRHGGAATMFGGNHSDGGARPVRLRDISAHDEPRIDMHDGELNRVLGGGLVPGSITLLGGEPGIGKSTLTLQTILHLPDMKVMYVSGEESAHQIKLRADRLASASVGDESAAGRASLDNVSILCETSLEKIFTHIQEQAPGLVVIDSIQTIATDEVESSPGSISQVRECAAALLRFAKTSGIPVILIGHINKEGTLAGPKILEHIVDTVVQFEGDQHYMYRILR
nr:AAA family ATPase [Prevotella sp.]